MCLELLPDLGQQPPLEVRIARTHTEECSQVEDNWERESFYVWNSADEMSQSEIQ